MNEITVCITSCNRFDLLKRTLDSFLKLNTYPIERIIITEDSTKSEMKQKISSYSNVELIFNPINLGIYKSVDNMYNLVQTPFIFHCEDDWEFSSNPNFLQESLDILEDQSIHQVWIRKDAPNDWVEQQTNTTKSGTQYNLMKQNHCGDWNGFSHNPGLRRLSDYKLMFPNGYQEFILPNQKAVFTEHNCMLNTKKFNYRAAILKNRACYHIGDGRTTL